jgi:P4 family phage/plasmid primase-like protien
MAELDCAQYGLQQEGGVTMSEATANFIKAFFGPTTTEPVFICSLPQVKDDPNEVGQRHVMTRDTEIIDSFVTKWDRSGRALYFCVGTIKAGSSRRAKETLAELVCIHVDIDWKDFDLSPAEIGARVRELRLQPTFIVLSGNGMHLYWLLKEALPAPESIERVEGVLRLAAHHLGGDPQVCEVSRLMRLPGSHNSKKSGWTEVRVITSRPALRYDIDELEEWFAEMSPVLRRRDDVDHDPDINAFIAMGERLGYKPPVDVEERLRTMRYRGAGDDAIHPTQRTVTASMLSCGRPLDEVVDLVLEATRVVAGAHADRWNWTRERKKIDRMCRSWVEKHPEILQQQAAAEEPAAAATGTDGETVVSLDRKRHQKQQSSAGPGLGASTSSGTKAKGAKPGNSKTEVLGEGCIAALRQRGQDLMLTQGDAWFYEAGVWRSMTPADEQTIKVLIQTGCRAMRIPPKIATLNTVWKYLMEHPDLHRPDVPWNTGTHIAVANGVIELATMAFGDWRPDYYLRRKLALTYDPAARCPTFLQWLSELFDVGNGYIGLLQEFAGTCLAVPLLAREERKALLIKGESRTCKTELASVFRHMVGDHAIASPSITDIGERFGLAPFINAHAWVRDDAVDEGDKLDPQRFKAIVTGEAIDIDRKNRSSLRVELQIPVILTCNSLPTAKDASNALYNRSLLIEPTRVFTEEETVTARAHYSIPRGSRFAHRLLEQEGPGVLNWALEGLARVMARGRYDIPTGMVEAVEAYKSENNPVDEWVRMAVRETPDGKVERSDALCALHGWQREEVGTDGNMRFYSGKWFWKRFRVAAPWVREHKADGRRFIVGIRLNAEGLEYWNRQREDNRVGGSKGSSLTAAAVNKHWDRKGDQNEDQSDDETPPARPIQTEF